MRQHLFLKDKLINQRIIQDKVYFVHKIYIMSDGIHGGFHKKLGRPESAQLPAIITTKRILHRVGRFTCICAFHLGEGPHDTGHEGRRPTVLTHGGHAVDERLHEARRQQVRRDGEDAPEMAVAPVRGVEKFVQAEEFAAAVHQQAVALAVGVAISGDKVHKHWSRYHDDHRQTHKQHRHDEHFSDQGSLSVYVLC